MKTLLIVDYKTPEKTMEYIGRFIQATNYTEFHFLVVDNSGESYWTNYCLQKDLKVELIQVQKKEYKGIWKVKLNQIEIFFVEANTNIGYARGNNLGVDISRLLWDDERILISNNDLEFPGRIDFNKFEDIFQKYHDVAVIGPMIKTPKGEQQSPHKINSIFKTLILKYPYLLICPRKLKKITDVCYVTNNCYTYWVTGCFMYIDTEKFYKCGKFDETTFLYCEEKILAERLKLKKMKMYFLADQVVIHNHGQTIKSAMSVLSAASIGFKSNLYYFNRYLTVPKWKQCIAKISFNCYLLLYPLKSKLKSSLGK